jgi:hypothetical protein
MQAQIYAGRPNLMMDHLQLGLMAAGETEPRVYLCLYAIPWSREIGAGHVALVRHRPAQGDPVDAILTDNPSLARALVDQLRSSGYSRIDLTGEPRAASFTRGPLREPEHVRYLIAAMGLEIDARWEDLGEPIFAAGPAPARPAEQEIWSMLFEAQTATVTVNQAAVPGDLYRLQNWVPWLGRSLCSAHVARGEILVDRPGPGRGWMVPPGA